MDIYAKFQNKTISDIIFQLRKEKNLTYSELEELTGVSRSVLYRIDRGETKHPGFRTVKAIATVFPTHYKEIMGYYIQDEERIDVLFEILSEIVSIEDHSSLVPMVALKILQSPQGETEDNLQRLYDFTGKISDSALKVILYKAIIKYSREHGVMKYLAKGLLQKHLIERLDLMRLEQSYQDGQEILHYTNFLSFEEQITLYLRMGLLAYAVKKYEDCIHLCQTGILMEKKDTELKARAYLAMINSYSQLKNYDEVEKNLDIFEQFNYDFVSESAKITRAITKARKKEYEVALPLLQKYLDELSKSYKIHIADELFEIYFEMGDLNACGELLEREKDFLPEDMNGPQICKAVGKYYLHKGEYKFSLGFIDEGIQSIMKSMDSYGKVSAFKEREECMNKIVNYCIKSRNTIKLKHLLLMKEVYSRK
ncbi:helix-turn-helix domain-containing protein [Paenibacillus tyrfis]|uniref:helix-turn-helix domain-containing protein n=1 Tax=Paenibacillus tyrfis TaxID=1501230 RepID=UPI00209C93EC|nr:helix-turn-helix transcriptional regulator [Paenibacillus tyrfis]MCP1312506.1 helix-turn-helix transcriptional regulator [Paenibacillus tyrfis]